MAHSNSVSFIIGAVCISSFFVYWQYVSYFLLILDALVYLNSLLCVFNISNVFFYFLTYLDFLSLLPLPTLPNLFDSFHTKDSRGKYSLHLSMIEFAPISSFFPYRFECPIYIWLSRLRFKPFTNSTHLGLYQYSLHLL